MEHVIEIPNPSPKWDNPIFCGWLRKYTITLGNVNWRKRFFVLTLDGCLWYFKSMKSTSPRKEPVVVKSAVFCRSALKSNCIQIVREEKPFYLYSEETETIEDLFKKLEIAGGIPRRERIIDDVIPEIASKNAKTWSKDLVKDWLSKQYLDKETTFLKYSEQLNISGKELLLQNENSLRLNGIIDFDHLETILTTIDDLRENEGDFDYGAFIVATKILNNVLTQKDGELVSIESLRGVAKDLYLLKNIQKIYLNYTPQPMEDPIFQAFKFDDDDDDDDKDNNNDDDDSEEEGESEEESEEEKEEKEEISLDGTFLGLASEANPPCFPESLRFDTVNKLHIIISDRINWIEYEKSYTVLSPLITSFPKNSKGGKLQVGVVVGPWLMMFNRSGLVIPKRMNSVLLKVTSLYDSVSIDHVELNEVVKVLSEITKLWNISKEYDEKTNNCVHFCEDLLSVFGIEMKSSSLKNLFQLMDPLVKEGCMDYVFHPGNAFQNHFNLGKGMDYKFDTHKELDEFVQTLVKIDEMGLQVDYPTEFQILKILDRAFWLSHFEDPENESFKPLLDEGKSSLEKGKYYSWWKKTKCVFEDPRKAMNDMWFFENENED